MITREQLEKYKAKYFVMENYRQSLKYHPIAFIIMLILNIMLFFYNWKLALITLLSIAFCVSLFLIAANRMMQLNKEVFIMERELFGMNDEILP